MKAYNYLLLSFLILMAMSCTTPYHSLKPLANMEELEYPMPVKKVFLPQNGYHIAYMEAGTSGPVVIFIHGLGSYAPAWKRNLEELSKNNRCIAIDLPGYGKSDKFPHSGRMSFYAGIIKELIAELNLGSVFLAGHSMGGQIAITTALLYPEQVKGLILVAPAGFETFTPGQKQWFRDIMTPKGVKLTTAEAIQTNLVTNFYRMPAEAEFMITDRLRMRNAADFDAYCYAVAQSVSGMVDEPVAAYLNDLNIPVIIFFGENDNLIPNRYLNPGATREVAEAGASRIRNSKLVMIPRCGHFLMFEKPEIFNRETEEFLKKHGR
ncbi:MAG: alpha/beta hydrolase [Bacteroidales bacterium]|jgi:pimeloyl-ACP methyl ester carboxylesterase|nr:alpha/beta hydrolase [Bacteroidales bacterium]NPV36948.1 alpha/beta hydrolase [Bacteroidales bacterium]